MPKRRPLWSLELALNRAIFRMKHGYTRMGAIEAGFKWKQFTYMPGHRTTFERLRKLLDHMRKHGPV